MCHDWLHVIEDSLLITYLKGFILPVKRVKPHFYEVDKNKGLT